MSETNAYPFFDPALADLLVCPFTGEPILRPKQVPGSIEHIRDSSIKAAAEHVLLRPGTIPMMIWVSPTADRIVIKVKRS